MSKLSTVFAPAKINLFLHVLGRRDDGYHDLESLVGFAEVGDRIALQPDEGLKLRISGPFGGDLEPSADNLVMRAARALRKRTAGAGADAAGAELSLDKILPVASGIGGGSADAAATLRGLRAMWDVRIDDAELADIALELGADVPVCLAGRTAMMRGIGDVLEAGPVLPPAAMLLVNPGEAVSTRDVFRGVQSFSNAVHPIPAGFSTVEALCAWLASETRNDLEGPARRIAPSVDRVLGSIADCEGVCLTRMSGSGATCFGVFASAAHADIAAARLRRTRPEWWVVSTALRSS